jgi:hypothetical protein
VGRGSREIGDRILIVGDLGVVVQVKSREQATDDAERERVWIRKNAAAALRQARGTVRRLRLEPTPLTNGRGREFLIHGNQFRWLAVVVIDHPDLPEHVELPEANADLPAVVLVRRDWRTGKVEELTTVGVLLTPRHDGKRPWDTGSATTRGTRPVGSQTATDTCQIHAALPMSRS